MHNYIRSFYLILALIMIALPTIGQTDEANTDANCLGGKPSAPLRMEVFSCFQCPPCRDFYLDTIRPLLKDYGNTNKVCIVYYEFPLKIHNYSREAARYGVAAQRLGQGTWQRVAEALFLEQPQWEGGASIEAVVARVTSPEEMAKLKKLLQDPSINQTIDRELLLGNKRQIRGTPTFFLYAKGREEKIAGKVSYPVLKDYLERLLK